MTINSSNYVTRHKPVESPEYRLPHLHTGSASARVWWICWTKPILEGFVVSVLWLELRSESRVYHHHPPCTRLNSIYFSFQIGISLLIIKLIIISVCTNIQTISNSYVLLQFIYFFTMFFKWFDDNNILTHKIMIKKKKSFSETVCT